MLIIVIIFLYGIDTYRSRQKLNEIIKKYKAKNKSGLNFVWLEFDENNTEDLKKATAISPMFREKKLIVLKGALEKNLDVQKKIVEFIKTANLVKTEEIIVIFYEKRPVDKQTELYKLLAKKPNIFQEFMCLEGLELENWVRKEVEKRGGKIEASAVKKIASYVGGNLWQMTNEIEKLVLYSLGKAMISEKDVDLLIKPEIELNIFQATDALARRDKKTAFKLLYQHLEKGEKEIYLLAMFIYQFRNLLKIKELVAKGLSSHEMRKRTGLHPFVIKKSWEQIKKFSLVELKRIYNKLLELDIAIKKGRIEPKTALDVLLMFI